MDEYIKRETVINHLDDCNVQREDVRNERSIFDIVIVYAVV